MVDDERRQEVVGRTVERYSFLALAHSLPKSGR